MPIAGRTSACTISDVDDCIARVKAYEAAGVDMIFLAGVKSNEQIEAVAAEVNMPMIIGGGPADLELCSKLGVRISLQGHKPIMAAVQGVYDTLKALRDGMPHGDIEYYAKPDLMKQVTRSGAHDRWMRDFLSGWFKNSFCSSGAPL